MCKIRYLTIDHPAASRRFPETPLWTAEVRRTNSLTTSGKGSTSLCRRTIDSLWHQVKNWQSQSKIKTLLTRIQLVREKVDNLVNRGPPIMYSLKEMISSTANIGRLMVLLSLAERSRKKKAGGGPWRRGLTPIPVKNSEWITLSRSQIEMGVAED